MSTAFIKSGMAAIFLASASFGSAIAQDIEIKNISAYDLSSEKGVDLLYTDIVTAARKACGVHRNGRRGLWQSSEERQCIDENVGKIVAALDDPSLNRRYAQSREGSRSATGR